jgi:hypothetical protein
MLRAAGVKRRSAPAKPTRPFEDVVIDFRVKYPEGFTSPAWKAVRDERDRMESVVREALNPDAWRDHLSRKQIGDLGRAHRNAVHASGIMHPVQAARFATIEDGGFWTFYADWVWRADSGASVFEEIVKGLAAVGQATWPNVTALRGLVSPKTEMFVKPESLKRTAAALRQDLPYETRPSYPGYVAILDFGKRVRDRLEREGLQPADYWDVLQFCKIVAGGAPDVAKPASSPKSKTKKVKADEAASV